MQIEQVLITKRGSIFVSYDGIGYNHEPSVTWFMKMLMILDLHDGIGYVD